MLNNFCFHVRDEMTEADPQLGQADSWCQDQVKVSGEDDPVPTLYHAGPSYYSQVDSRR